MQQKLERMAQLKFHHFLLLVIGFAFTPIPVSAGPAEKEARKGVGEYEQKKFDKAAESFKKAAEIKPDSAAIQYDLGTALAQKGDYDKAAEALSRSLEIPKTPDPSHAHYNLGYSQVRQAQAGSKEADPKEIQAKLQGLRSGMDQFRQAIIADPKDADAKHNYEVTKFILQQLEEQLRQQQQQQKQGQQGDQKDDNKGEKPDQKGDKGPDGQKPDPDGKSKSDQQKEEEQKDKQENQDKKDQDASKNKDQQDKDSKDPAKQQSGLESTPTPAPSPTPQPGQQPQPQPTPSNQDKNKNGQGGASGAEEEKPLTPEQLDALRVLNSIQDNHPEQFKRLFKFQGRASGAKPSKDW